MDMLFDDPWFQSVEMCIYESPDQEVNPFVLPGLVKILIHTQSQGIHQSTIHKRHLEEVHSHLVLLEVVLGADTIVMMKVAMVSAQASEAC